jgi:uncharacterized protein (TIGR04551 family)
VTRGSGAAAGAPLAVLTCWLVAAAGDAYATGFTEVGDDLVAPGGRVLDAHGALRARGEALYNLDLDTGLGPSGEPLFPVPISDAGAQTLTDADLRLRTDVSLRPAMGGLAARVRLDVVDDELVVRRVYGEALTPVGLLTIGRMGSHWGLGMLVNGGDCDDCDDGDRADRIGFVSPLVGHLLGVAFDVGRSGPAARRKAGERTVSLDPTDDVLAVTVAVLRWNSGWVRDRRRRAGKSTVEYGVYASHQWQTNDVPADWLALPAPAPIDAAQVVHRGYRATAVDLWFRVTTPSLRLEGEAALLVGGVDQPSLIPGVLLRDGVEFLQYGAALECDLGSPDAPFGAGVDVGFASGDPAPGFGAFPGPTDAPSMPGDLDGPQAAPPSDRRVDNLRFHPDYRVDRILFREIVGTVTDAAYVRPRIRWRALAGTAGSLTVDLAAVGSMAIEPASTPGGARPLGVELDPGVTWRSRDGFSLAAEYAVLFPLEGLDGANAARTAHLFRLRAMFSY